MRKIPRNSTHSHSTLDKEDLGHVINNIAKALGLADNTVVAIMRDDKKSLEVPSSEVRADIQNLIAEAYWALDN